MPAEYIQSLPRRTVIDLGCIDSQARAGDEAFCVFEGLPKVPLPGQAQSANDYLEKEFFYNATSWEEVGRVSPQTQNEHEIFSSHVSEIAEPILKAFGTPFLIELGSGFSKKLDVLLQYLEERGKECVCAFVDIDSGAVWHQVLKFSLKHVSVFGLRGTFDQARQWTKQRLPPDVPRFAFSLGSTLSNAHPKKAQRNLQAWCGGYNPFGVFIGQDAPDEEDTLRNSYDKSEWSAFLQTGMRWLCTYLGASDVPDNAWVLDHGVAVSPRRHFFVFYFKKPIRFGHMTVPAESSIRVFDSYKYTTGEIADIAYAAKACVHSSWTQATSTLYYIASETGDKPETEHLLHTLWLSRYLSDYVPITDLIARSVVESLEMAPSRQIELLFRNALRQRCPNAEFDPLQHDLNLTIRQLCSPQGSFSLEVNGPESREMIIGALGKLNGAYGHDWADLVTGYDGTCFAFAVAQAIGILCGKLGLNPPAEFHGWLAMINWLIEEDLTQNSPGH